MKLETGNYHLVGVAGVGMSSVALALLGQGYAVSGSDRYLDTGDSLDVLKKLERAGVRLCAQDGRGVRPDTAGVVVSTAIEADNPDIATAQRLNVPVIHRAEMLGKLVAGKRCIAVTGTSGKSTVTGMLGWILEQVGEDPTVVNGAPVLNWFSETTLGNARTGNSDLWVIEADESDRSLMNFHPDWAIITNVSRDHFEYEETLALFKRFSMQVKVGRVSVIEEPGLLADFRPDVSAGGSDFRHNGMSFRLNLPGRHNAQNAFMAVVLCGRLGYDLGAVSAALAGFKGIQRRLEVVGVARGVTVIDDYAHNPAKIRAAFETLAPYHARLLAVWRPHGFKPLRVMMDELVAMFGEVCRPADRLYLLPVYDAGGTADRSVNSDVLVARLRARGVAAEYVSDVALLEGRLAGEAAAGDVVITMGARDPDLPALARRFLGRLSA